jgi:hypothetical protein
LIAGLCFGCSNHEAPSPSGSIEVQWQRGRTSTFVTLQPGERAEARCFDVEVRLDSETIRIGGHRYGPVHDGDKVKLTEDAVIINGVVAEPLP